jgi:hypothetical protein
MEFVQLKHPDCIQLRDRSFTALTFGFPRPNPWRHRSSLEEGSRTWATHQTDHTSSGQDSRNVEDTPSRLSKKVSIASLRPKVEPHTEIPNRQPGEVSQEAGARNQRSDAEKKRNRCRPGRDVVCSHHEIRVHLIRPDCLDAEKQEDPNTATN